MPANPASVFKSRLDGLRKQLRNEAVDAALIESRAKLRYLIGFTGSNGLLVLGADYADFYTDGRYRTQAKAEVRGVRVTVGARDLVDNLPAHKKLNGGRPKIAYEAQATSVARLEALKAKLPQTLFVECTDLVDPLAMRKDAGEIASIREAIRVAEESLGAILQLVSPGVREFELAAELEYQMKMRGSDDPAFDTIVASGPRSALPHGRAARRRIKTGDFITFDFGAIVDGYVSDITRTFVVGKASARQRKVYETVRRAQAAAIRRCRPATACAAVDKVARDAIAKAGFGKHFDHGLGHGIGLLIHEGPVLSSRSTQYLQPGMVVTVEPGVYFPGWGGVRIEDDVLITNRGREVLTSFEKRLMELG